jgi:hypothetical protein
LNINGQDDVLMLRKKINTADVPSGGDSGNTPGADTPPLEWMFAFDTTRDAIEGEKLLLAAGLAAGVMPLPGGLGAGCGICLRVGPGDLEQARSVSAFRFQAVYAVRPADSPDQPGSSGKKIYTPWNA